jgi:hypothetical protein
MNYNAKLTRDKIQLQFLQHFKPIQPERITPKDFKMFRLIVTPLIGARQAPQPIRP